MSGNANVTLQPQARASANATPIESELMSASWSVKVVPAVSIIMPTFNRVRYIRAAIDSVLSQSFEDWELIVADDGSTEETRAYLRTFMTGRVRATWLAHCGNPGHVRNRAIGIATGHYLAFIDSDDIWAPRKLEKQINLLRGSPDRRWSYTRCDRIDEDGRPIVDDALRRRVPPDGWILEQLLRDQKNQMAMASVVAARDFVEEIGGFDEEQRWCEDYALYLRLAMRSKVAVVPEELCSVRNHTDHYSGNRAAEYQSRMNLYGKMGRLVADPALRSICKRKRAEQSLILAGIHGDKRDYRAVGRTLAAASAYSWSYPDWWFGALKAAVRPFVPKGPLDAYRRGRR